MKRLYMGVIAATAMALVGGKVGAQGNWRNWQDPNSGARGNCPDCQAGEARAESTMAVPHGIYVDSDNPPCGDASFNAPQIPDPLKDLAASAFYAQGGLVGSAASFALGFTEQLLAGALREIENMPGDIPRLFRSRRPDVSSCARLLVTMPKSVTITRIVPTMHCPAGGWCGFASAPVTDEIDGDLFGVTVVAKNWSHNVDASATLRVYYRR